MDDGSSAKLSKCGIYCGACIGYLGKIDGPAGQLEQALKGWNFADVFPSVFPEEFSEERIEIFAAVLHFLATRITCKNCDSEAQLFSCPIRACCDEKGITTCGECSILIKRDYNTAEPCDNEFMALVTKRYGGWNIQNLKRVNKVGLEKFSQEMDERIANGFDTGDVITKTMVFTNIRKNQMKS